MRSKPWLWAIAGLLASQLGGHAQAADLSAYSATSRNDIGEEELRLTILSERHALLQLALPKTQVDTNDWQRSGHLHLDWRHCQTREMLTGAGELTQCIRRAFLSIHGEADTLAPAVLDLQVQKDGTLLASYQPEGVATAQALRVVATTTAAGPAWQSFYAALDRTTLPNPVALPAKATLADDDAKSAEFIFFGDGGTGDRNQYKVAKGIEQYCSGQTKCDFGLMLGDNFYKAGVGGSRDAQWQTKFAKPYGKLGIPFYPALGNHDHLGNVQAQIDYSARSSLWRMPGRYYAFEKGNVAFFAIDSDDFDSRQAAWLKSGLASTGKVWKIVYGHHPVYSDGRHGDTQYLIDGLLPLLKQYGVDFYLCGHDHMQEIIQRSGLTFVVTGSGGASLYPVDPGEDSPFSAAAFGFSHFSIDATQAKLQMVDATGQVEYEHVYTKAAAAPAGQLRTH